MWTCRSGGKLDEAVEFCRSKGLDFYAINKNYSEEIFDNSISRKIKADMYYGGLPDWGEIYTSLEDPDSKSIKSKRGFAKLFRK